MPRENVEFEFPDPDKDEALEVESSSAEDMVRPGAKPEEPEAEEPKAEEAPVEVAEEPEVEVEVYDDTPEEDQGRKPSEPPADVTDEELGEYSEKVQKRIKHFSKGYHDERRAKEQAMRERDELVNLTKKLLDEKQKLEGDYGKSREALLSQAKSSAEVELESAKKSYRDAYNEGDPDAVLAAQERLTAASIRLDKVKNIKLPPLQPAQTDVQSTQQVADTPVQQPAKPQPDPKAVSWAKRNTWFGPETEMTDYAILVHKKLVTQGVDPNSDDYYARIDERMRELFPDYFDGGDEVLEKPKPVKQAASVVAPASRSTAPNKVRLSRSQHAIAKRLGVSPEQYAKQVALLRGQNNG